ncbi:hypothetical protein M3Y95_00576900 [Aphelenchoides besseyi]|nr:hypothetical protein M3Y95_00576900 [Aphelenchoides besseyi]
MLSRRLFSAKIFISRSSISANKFGFQIYTVRDIRTRTENGNEKKTDGSETTSESKKTSDPPKPPPFSQLNAEQKKKLRILGLISFLGSSAMTFWLLSKTRQTQGFAGFELGSEPVPFDVFIEKFLKAGEVKSILYAEQQGKALVTLHEDAVVDGRKFDKNMIVVSYNSPTGQAGQFQNEIRSIEHDLKVSSFDQVPITVVHTPSAFRIFEFMLGGAIIIFLFTQYGRLAARRIIAQKKTPEQKP